MTDARPAGSSIGTGAPAASDRNALTVGADGPILLHDTHFIEQMAHFNRERVPERNVHAKGTGAFGSFVVTDDVSAYTKAAVEIPALHQVPEEARRQRPARQRHAVGLLDAQPGVGPPGHLADGRPRHPSHAAAHEWLRIRCLTQEAADRLAGEDADFHRRDLHEAIARGAYPSWTLYVQVMPYLEGTSYRFNPFDLTKVWPHRDYPLVRVGSMTLNENPANFFAQIEQAAFEPSAIVPGIGFSPDKMLLGRTFAYSDTHRYRIGPNYLQLPVNRHRVDGAYTYQFDGPMAYDHAGDRAKYAPNSYDPFSDDTGPADEGWAVDGEMMRAAYTPRRDDDDFGQAGTMVRDVFDGAARDRFVSNVAGHILGGVKEETLPRVFDYWRSVDSEIGKRIEEAVQASQAAPHDADQDGIVDSPSLR